MSEANNAPLKMWAVEVEFTAQVELCVLAREPDAARSLAEMHASDERDRLLDDDDCFSHSPREITAEDDVPQDWLDEPPYVSAAEEMAQQKQLTVREWLLELADQPPTLADLERAGQLNLLAGAADG